MDRDTLKQYRQFLKDSIRKSFDFSRTEQSRGIPPPPIEKPFRRDALRINLPSFGRIGKRDLPTMIGNRESRRSYDPRPLSLEELSFLLWATQGVRRKLDEGHALRMVPSAGCRHALETYLFVLRVRGLDRGIYRYLPLEHQLETSSTSACS